MSQWKFEALSPTIQVCVSKEHRFGTDAFLLADFARHGSKDRVLDLCTGCGILPLLLCKRRPPKEIHGLELQPEAVELMKQGVEKSGLGQRVFPHEGDLRRLLPPAEERLTLEGLTPFSFDLVTCNPPYFDSRGILSEQKSQRIARHETDCTLEQVCGAASRMASLWRALLSVLPSGTAEPTALRPYPSVAGTQTAAHGAKGSPVSPVAGFMRGKKGAKPFLQVLPPLFIRGQEEGGFSKELIRIYDWQKNGELPL